MGAMCSTWQVHRIELAFAVEDMVAGGAGDARRSRSQVTTIHAWSSERDLRAVLVAEFRDDVRVAFQQVFPDNRFNVGEG